MYPISDHEYRIQLKEGDMIYEQLVAAANAMDSLKNSAFPSITRVAA